MAYDPSCTRCRLARRLGRAAIAFVALGSTVWAPRETGWLNEEPLAAVHVPDPAVNATLGASASMLQAGSNIFGGWVRITVDKRPDQ